MNLEQTLKAVQPLDHQAMAGAQARLDDLTKPPGSLGALETMAKKMAGIYGEPLPSVGKKTIVLMAGDHGVVAEGVSAFPQEVTPQMVLNFLNGGAGINVLARHVGAELICVDIGVAADLPELPGLKQKKVAYGTKNMALEPAMSREQAVRAIEIGIEVVREAVNNGSRILGTGDMGIGNTTPSSAIIAALGKMQPLQVVGAGTGLEPEKVLHKAKVVEKALEINQVNPDDPLDVLAKVGGLEIAGLAGVILGAAASRVPVVVDGFISGAAAVVAGALCPQSKDYMFGSHLSEEPGHRFMLEYLGLKPVLTLNMRLGEGTGGALAMGLLDASLKIIHEMATFSSAGVSGKI